MASYDDVDPVAKVAKERFGLDYVYPLQRMAIANALDAQERSEGMRQMVLFPTGFGKSVCFQLPALLMPGPTVVVYPLLALMSDQRRSLERRGVKNALFRGGMSAEETRREEDAVRSGEAKIVITNPESLSQPRLLEFLRGVKPSHLAIDEAHCVSEWGETFRPAYLKLGEAIEKLAPPAVSAFTATASPEVADAITRILFSGEAPTLVTTDIDKPAIFYSIEPTLSPLHTLSRLVASKPRPLIVFDNSRIGVYRLANLLAERTGLDTRYYHAGLTREEKTATEEWFMSSDSGVLVATCAYGMGVDKRNVRTVVHFRRPESVEAYLQESGRGGRDGLKSEAILIDSVLEQKKYGHAACPSQEASGAPSGALSPEGVREARAKAFAMYASKSGCRRATLISLMGLRLEGPCSGCDVCEQTAKTRPEGAPELERFFKANRGRFDASTSLRLLSMRLPGSGLEGAVRPRRPSKGGPPLCPGSGALAGWDDRDARILVQDAITAGFLLKSKSPLRRDKLILNQKIPASWQ